MGRRTNTSGKVFDKIDRLCTWMLAFSSNVPRKYYKTLWEPLRLHLDMAQACAEMAYFEIDVSLETDSDYTTPQGISAQNSASGKPVNLGIDIGSAFINPIYILKLNFLRITG